MYRPPTVPPKGQWARFLQAMRRERDWNQTQAFEALREGLHLGPKSRAAYLALDSGARPPKPAEVEYLTSYFGKGPDDAPLAEPEQDGLVAAIRDQTAAINALAKAIEAERAGRSEWERGLLEGLRDLLGASPVAARSTDRVPGLRGGH